LLVSQLLRASFRGADQLYRFGGEEFVVVLDHASAAGADTAFGRLRTAIESYRFPQVGTVTVSVGYTRVLASDAPASAFERADAALYYAKHNGRNRALGYEQLIADGCIERKETRADVELF
jgi:diguanylate cyclase (GGDEF)-like protein